MRRPSSANPTVASHSQPTRKGTKIDRRRRLCCFELCSSDKRLFLGLVHLNPAHVARCELRIHVSSGHNHRLEFPEVLTSTTSRHHVEQRCVRSSHPTSEFTDELVFFCAPAICTSTRDPKECAEYFSISQYTILTLTPLIDYVFVDEHNRHKRLKGAMPTPGRLRTTKTNSVIQ